MRKTTQKGFTLIELLVVIAIIGLLSSVVLAALDTARSKGNDAQRLSDLRAVQQALEIYATSNNNSFPNTSGAWVSQCSGGGAWTQTDAEDAIPGLTAGGYIPTLPTDPEQNVTANTCCYLYQSDGTDYKYMLYNCPTSAACYGNSIAQGVQDPARSTTACSVYTPGASGW